MKKIIYLVISFIAIAVVIVSCKKDNNSNDYIENNIITYSQAKSIVINTLKSNQLNDVKFIDGSTFSDKNGVAAIYSVNYVVEVDTFFTLLSANKNTMSILANGDGPFLNDNVVEGVSIWLNEQIKAIEFVTERNLTETQYKEDFLNADIIPGDDPCEGQNYLIQKGPLMSSLWGQGCYYNDNLSTGCSENCGHKLTGCVATAVGQVMNYYNHPSSYNWNLILDSYNNYSTSSQIEEVASLMYDIGVAVNMTWGCSSSGANTCSYVPGAFTGTFGYSTANSCTNYQYPQPIKTEIDYNRPVIFRGEDASGSHAWVCDGYKEQHFCEEDNGVVYSWIYLYYHLNWGWNGSQNGWFAYNNFGMFGNNQKVILNIKP